MVAVRCICCRVWSDADQAEDEYVRRGSLPIISTEAALVSTRNNTSRDCLCFVCRLCPQLHYGKLVSSSAVGLGERDAASKSGRTHSPYFSGV